MKALDAPAAELQGVMRNQNVLAALCFSVAVACGVSEGPSLRDYGEGVEIIHNARPTEDQRLTAVRSLLLGEADGDSANTFGRVAGLAVASNGRITVVDAYAQRISVFDAQGRLVRVFGRAGRGPGEFQNAGRVWVWRDTLLVEDLDAGRFTAFDTAGAVLGIAPIGSADGARTFLVTRAAPGWLGEIRSVAAGNSGAGAWRLPLTRMEVVDPKGARTLRQLYEVQHPDTASAPVLFGGAYQAGTLGYTYLYLLGHGTPYEIHMFSLEGGVLRRVVRQEYEPKRVARAWLRTAEKRITDHYATRPTPPGWSGGANEQLRRLADVPVAQSVAAARRIVVDSAGFAWVQRQDLSSDMSDLAIEYLGLGIEQRGQTTWDIFQPSGVLVGQVALPSGFRLMAVDGTSAYGIAIDSDGVARIVKYEIRGSA